MDENIHYTVCWGDTLESIANQFDVSAQEVKHTNSIEEIYIGKVLIIPNNTETTIPTKKIIISKSLGYYLKRHAKKKHIFNFYFYKKSHR